MLALILISSFVPFGADGVACHWQPTVLWMCPHFRLSNWHSPSSLFPLYAEICIKNVHFSQECIYNSGSHEKGELKNGSRYATCAASNAFRKIVLQKPICIADFSHYLPKRLISPHNNVFLWTREEKGKKRSQPHQHRTFYFAPPPTIENKCDKTTAAALPRSHLFPNMPLGGFGGWRKNITSSFSS